MDGTSLYSTLIALEKAKLWETGLYEHLYIVAFLALSKIKLVMAQSFKKIGVKNLRT